MKIKPSGFREYDARWLYPNEIDLGGLEELGKGLGSQIIKRINKTNPKIIVGHDYRSYSEDVKNALKKGLISTGCNINDIGLSITPTVYFAQFKLNSDAVAMVTASHNENGWTGVKMGIKKGLTHAPEEMKELKDITCCPGSETCNLGITASRGLATALSAEFEKNYTKSNELDNISVKMSGCPNSCGQHHIASIGFHGGAKKINGILAPHYEIMMGGRVNEDQVTFATSVIKIPAKNAPEAIRLTSEAYKKEKIKGESFVEFFDRKGKTYFTKMLDPLKNLAPIDKDPYSYIDYGSEETYSLEDRGQGECAGPLTDMISENILAAERSVFQGKLALEKNDFNGALESANCSIVAAANGLLITEGMDFQDPKETLEKFAHRVANWEERISRVHNTAEIIIAKQRHGPVGNVKLMFDGQFTRFGDLDFQYEESESNN